MTRTAEKTYAEFAARLLATGLVSDPWLWGRPRFRPEPVVLKTAEKAALDAAAESVAMAHHHLMLQVAAEPGLLDSFFGLTPCQKLMALAAGPHWHGIGRADVFRTVAGPIVCELNSDTPSGEAEAVLLGGFAALSGRVSLPSVAAAIRARFGEGVAERNVSACEAAFEFVTAEMTEAARA